MTAENTLTTLCRRIPKNALRGFLYGLGLGLATHLYVLLNLLPNRDAVTQVFGHGALATSGRWFLKVFTQLNSCFTLPWVNGLISILALAVCCAFVVRLLEVEEPVLIALICAALITFPSVANTLGYMFTADAYFIALMIFVLAVYLADRTKWGFWAAIPMMVLATACYQSYLCFAVALMAVRGLMLLAQGERTDKEILLKLATFVFTAAAAALIYFAVNKLIGRVLGIPQTDYMGIDQMGRFSLDRLPGMLWTAYRRYFSFLWTETRLHGGTLAAVCNMGLLAVSGALFIMSLVKKRRTPLQTALFIGVFLLMPLFLNSVYLLGAAMVHILMLYPIALTGAAAVVLYRSVRPAGRALTCLHALAGWGMAALLAAASLLWGLYANKGYLELHLKYENSYAMLTRVLDRVEQLEGYTEDTPLVVLGKLEDGNYPPTKERPFTRVGESVGFGTIYEYGFINDDEHVHDFTRYFLGVFWHSLTEEQQTWVPPLEEVRAMPCYPAQGSVILLNGVVVVMLGDIYG